MVFELYYVKVIIARAIRFTGIRHFEIQGFSESLQGRDDPASLCEYTLNVESRRKTT